MFFKHFHTTTPKSTTKATNINDENCPPPYKTNTNNNNNNTNYSPFFIQQQQQLQKQTTTTTSKATALHHNQKPKSSLLTRAQNTNNNNNNNNNNTKNQHQYPTFSHATSPSSVQQQQQQQQDITTEIKHFSIIISLIHQLRNELDKLLQQCDSRWSNHIMTGDSHMMLSSWQDHSIMFDLCTEPQMQNCERMERMSQLDRRMDQLIKWENESVNGCDEFVEILSQQVRKFCIQVDGVGEIGRRNVNSSWLKQFCSRRFFKEILRSHSFQELLRSYMETSERVTKLNTTVSNTTNTTTTSLLRVLELERRSCLMRVLVSIMNDVLVMFYSTVVMVNKKKNIGGSAQVNQAEGENRCGGGGGGADGMRGGLQGTIGSSGALRVLMEQKRETLERLTRDMEQRYEAHRRLCLEVVHLMGNEDGNGSKNSYETMDVLE